MIGEAQLTPIHEADITLGELACAEPLSIGLHAVRRAGELLGRSVLVTGGGTIGCMSVMAARAAGAARVCVSEPNERARRMALGVGADEAVRADAAALAPLAERFDVCIEAAGSPAGVAACLERGAARRARRAGRHLAAEASTFPANSIMARELDYLGAFRAEHEFDWAVQSIRTRRVDVRPLISAQIPLQRALEAFELAPDRSRSTKVQLVGAD